MPLQMPTCRNLSCDVAVHVNVTSSVEFISLQGQRATSPLPPNLIITNTCIHMGVCVCVCVSMCICTSSIHLLLISYFSVSLSTCPSLHQLPTVGGESLLGANEEEEGDKDTTSRLQSR